MKRINIGLWHGIRNVPVDFRGQMVFAAGESVSIGETRQREMTGDEFFDFIDANGRCKVWPYEGEWYVYFSDKMDGDFGQK